MTNPILFIVHGSSRPEANQFMVDLVADLLPDSQFALAFLECASPSIPEALAHWAKAGAKEVKIIPLFLAPGNHTTRDIPKLLEEAAEKYPLTRFKLEPFLGSRPEFRELLGKLVDEVQS